MNKRINDEMGTAYHEVGHAIASFRLRPDAYYDRISIIPDNEKGTLGSYNGEGITTMDGSDFKDIIIELFAGYAAERIYNPDVDIKWSGNDTERALELLQCVEGETEESLREQADILIKENWKYIEILSQYLYEHKVLSGEEWTIIVYAIDDGEDWKVIMSQWYSRFGKTPGYMRSYYEK